MRPGGLGLGVLSLGRGPQRAKIWAWESLGKEKQLSAAVRRLLGFCEGFHWSSAASAIAGVWVSPEESWPHSPAILDALPLGCLGFYFLISKPVADSPGKYPHSSISGKQPRIGRAQVSHSPLPSRRFPVFRPRPFLQAMEPRAGSRSRLGRSEGNPHPPLGSSVLLVWVESVLGGPTAAYIQASFMASHSCLR